ncbi:hypothetical protein EMMF5_006503 [Cystobasidiomycetes sp. EMM_F5]
MARGLQKVQSQQKAKEREAAKAGGKSILKTGKGLKCLQEIDSVASLKQHWENKHPKDPDPNYESCKIPEK